jgi:hypothetical protein
MNSITLKYQIFQVVFFLHTHFCNTNKLSIWKHCIWNQIKKNTSNFESSRTKQIDFKSHVKREPSPPTN